MAVATGGTVAAAAVIANPPLPLTLASGVPPGIFFFQISKKRQFCVKILASSTRVYLLQANFFEKFYFL